MYSQIIFSSILLGLSAFFSGSETALTSLSKIQLENIRKTRTKGYQALHKLKDKPKKMLITILIGNNLVNIWLSALSTLMATNYFQSNVLGIVVGIVTFLILVFGEILPKNFCVVYNKKIALLVARPILIIQVIMWPAIKILEIINYSFFTILNLEEPNTTVTEEEIKTTLALGKKHGTLDKESTEIMNEVLDFSNTRVDEIMTPINDVFTLSANKKLCDIKHKIVETTFSRIPIYDTVKKEYVGILHVSEVVRALSQNKDNITLKNLSLNPVLYVPETKKIGELLKNFQDQRNHVAIVIDEYGNIDGLVSLEDVIEELVGDILDETDREEHFIKKVNKNEYIIDGRVTLDYLKKRLKINLKSDEVNTVNGYILESFGRVPKKENKMNWGRKEIIIKSCSKTKVKKVKLKL